MKTAKIESSDSHQSLDDFKVPEGWLLSSVGELFQIVGGGTPSTKNPEYWEGDIPWISSADIYGLKKIVPRRNINQTAIKNSAAHLVPKGSIIVVTRVNLGRIAISDTPISFSQDCHALNPKTDSVYPEFALYYLSQAVQSFKNQSRGTTISGVTVKVVSSLPFPLPTFVEQQRIVARVEAVLAHINAARDRLSRVPLIMKRFRQGVLAAACSGRLTEGWRELHEGNIDNNKIIVNDQNIDTDLNVNFELPDSWIWTNLDSVCEIKSGNAFSSKDFRDNGVTAIKISNIGYGDFLWKNQEFLPEDFLKKFPDFIVSPNDLLIALTRPITNDTVKICLYPKDAPIGLLNQRVAMVKPSNNYEKNLLLYYLQSNLFKEQISFGIAETLQPNLSPLKMGKFIIPLPPFAEQYEIVRRVGALFERADAIDREVVAATMRTDALTQAVLGKAFAGKL